MKILFDFELDTQIKPAFPVSVCERIRRFYLERYKPLESLADSCVADNEYAVMLLIFAKEGIKSVPLTIPDVVAAQMHALITQKAFDALQEELAIVFKD